MSLIGDECDTTYLLLLLFLPGSYVTLGSCRLIIICSIDIVLISLQNSPYMAFKTTKKDDQNKSLIISRPHKSCTKGQKVCLLTNHFKVSICSTDVILYHYNVSICIAVLIIMRLVFHKKINLVWILIWLHFL